MSSSSDWKSRLPWPRAALTAGWFVFLFQILNILDSRTLIGQENTLGHVLEQELSQFAENRWVEVLSAGAGQPDAYFDYLKQHGLKFDPDLVVVGITLANDMSQVYATKNNLSFKDDLVSELLPDDAYSGDYTRLLPVRLDRSFYSWRGYRRIRPLLLPEGVGSWYDDVPGEVHAFDPSHALGYFYTRQTLTSVDQSFDEMERSLSGIVAICREARVELVFAIFPQRFQVSEREWRAAVFRYALDRNAFDLEHPNRRIHEMCDQLDARCTDLLDPMAQHSSKRLYLPRGDMHWSERGHRVAGEALANYLAPFVASEE